MNRLRVHTVDIRGRVVQKGLDAARVGMMMAAFSCKWNADKVFDDERPRKMHEIYNREGMELLSRDF